MVRDFNITCLASTVIYLDLSHLQVMFTLRKPGLGIFLGQSEKQYGRLSRFVIFYVRCFSRNFDRKYSFALTSSLQNDFRKRLCNIDAENLLFSKVSF